MTFIRRHLTERLASDVELHLAGDPHAPARGNLAVRAAMASSVAVARSRRSSVHGHVKSSSRRAACLPGPRRYSRT